MFDRAVFYNAIRPHLNLTERNVFGIERHLNYAISRETGLFHLAYYLATSWWETGQEMRPVEEAWWVKNAQIWRKKNLRYFPWHGRGLVQTTHKENYRKIAVAMGLPAETFIKRPELLLEWDYALPAMWIGMEKGIYTGRTLDDYIDGADEPDNEDLREFANARRVVNGTDKAVTIAKIALHFEHALRVSGYATTTKAPDAPVDLRQGSQGAVVRQVQELLNRSGAALKVDGDFGPMTASAVAAFQFQNLIQYGTVGPLTWAALSPEAPHASNP